MVNVTVINGKDTVKYLVRIIIAVVIVGILARFFCSLKADNNNNEILQTSENTEKQENDFGMKALAFCINEEIPIINESKQDEDTIPSYKVALTKELRDFRFDRKEKYSKR